MPKDTHGKVTTEPPHLDLFGTDLFSNPSILALYLMKPSQCFFFLEKGLSYEALNLPPWRLVMYYSYAFPRIPLIVRDSSSKPQTQSTNYSLTESNHTFLSRYTPLKINMEHNSLDHWRFGSDHVPFQNRWVCMFQPLIFQGVTSSKMEHLLENQCWLLLQWCLIRLAPGIQMENFMLFIVNYTKNM